MTWTYQPDLLGEILLAGGYDVTMSDVVYGRKDTSVVHEIFIDQAGRVRFTVTAHSSAPQARQVTIADRGYRVLQEQQHITTAVAQLYEPGALATVLHDLESLVATLSSTPTSLFHSEERSDEESKSLSEKWTNTAGTPPLGGRSTG